MSTVAIMSIHLFEISTIEVDRTIAFPSPSIPMTQKAPHINR
jgi:hypothetical protein